MARATVALALVGFFFLLFAYQTVADRKYGEAIESGLVGVGLLVGAFYLGSRLVARERRDERFLPPGP